MAGDVLIEETEFATRDPDQARDFLGAAYGENKLRVFSPLAANGVLSVDRVDAPRMSVTEAVSDTDLEIEYASTGDEVFISTIVEGELEIDHKGWNGEGVDPVGPGDVVLAIQPGTEWTQRTHPVTSTAIGISEGLLRETAGFTGVDTSTGWQPLGSRPIRERVNVWREVTAFAQRTLRDPVIGEAGLVVGQLERLVAAAALRVFPNKLMAGAGNTEYGARPEIVRRAIAFMESDPQSDMSLTEIAAAAHASQRSLQTAFRRHLDTTPMKYLRRVRVQQVREELLRATPGDGVTVQGVALSWGFPNQGRLAAYYKEQYGELPYETLRRC